MPVVNHEALRTFSAEILMGVGASSEAAQVVASHLVEANLVGHDSHGVIRLLQYCEHARGGQMNPQAEPEIIRESSTTALVDGSLTWGPVVARFAMDLAIDKAQLHGLAAVSLRNAYHVGMVGTYPSAAAAKGLIGMAFCNVQGTGRVAPWGAREPRLGTNPISIAVPSEGDPIVVDMATSAVAEGKVRVAKTEGTPVPLGWVLGPDGEFSTNPNDAYEQGALAPLGGDQGHKGYCLSVAVDLLAGVLAGTPCGLMGQQYANGLLFQVINPDQFCEQDVFRRGVHRYGEYLKSAVARDGVEKVLLPGDIERQKRRQRLAEGVSIGGQLWEQLTELGASLGVSFKGASRQ